MIKLLIFDLDGVLIDSKDAHFSALNKALSFVAPEYIISYRDHIAHFDGLPTGQKLNKLSVQGLDSALHESIKKYKQEFTIDYIEEFVGRDDRLIAIFRRLKACGYVIHVASNAIRHTVNLTLFKLGIMRYVDYVISNEDVEFSKPKPEMYLRCMLNAKVGPKETMILEDSYVGRQGVHNSGAFLGPINSPQDVTLERIENMILSTGSDTRSKWKDPNLNVLIPAAGAGSRFAQAGYTFPKPLIEVHGKKPMIDVVVNNLNMEAHFIFLVQKDHCVTYNLQYLLELIAPGCDVVEVDGITEGAACTTLLAKQLINNDKQLVIANSDQWMDWDSNEFMYTMQGKVDGGITTFNATHPKWSYAKVDDTGTVSEVQEKKPISEWATSGVYFWKKGSDYVKYAEEMIEKNLRVNNEFYVCPVYNQAIQDGKIIKHYPIKKMMGLGTPEDLEYFQSALEK